MKSATLRFLISISVIFLGSSANVLSADKVTVSWKSTTADAVGADNTKACIGDNIRIKATIVPDTGVTWEAVTWEGSITDGQWVSLSDNNNNEIDLLADAIGTWKVRATVKMVRPDLSTYNVASDPVNVVIQKPDGISKQNNSCQGLQCNFGSPSQTQYFTYWKLTFGGRIVTMPPRASAHFCVNSAESDGLRRTSGSGRPGSMRHPGVGMGVFDDKLAPSRVG